MKYIKKQNNNIIYLQNLCLETKISKKHRIFLPLFPLNSD